MSKKVFTISQFTSNVMLKTNEKMCPGCMVSFNWMATWTISFCPELSYQRLFV